MSRRIHVRIDRVVLDGVDPGDRAAFAAALGREIGRQLGQADPQAIAARGDAPRIDAGRIAQGADAGAVAGAVVRAIGGRAQ